MCPPGQDPVGSTPASFPLGAHLPVQDRERAEKVFWELGFVSEAIWPNCGNSSESQLGFSLRLALDPGCHLTSERSWSQRYQDGEEPGPGGPLPA